MSNGIFVEARFLNSSSPYLQQDQKGIKRGEREESTEETKRGKNRGGGSGPLWQEGQPVEFRDPFRPHEPGT